MSNSAMQGALDGAGDGFFATVKEALTGVVKTGIEASEKYMSDQWGLSTSGNGVDQMIFREQDMRPAGSATTAQIHNAGLVDLNVGPNTALVLVIAGVILFIAFSK